MYEDLAFLRAIFNQPDNDGLRLIYADWLDEHDEPERAEYLRVQCELVQTWFYDRPCRELFTRIADLETRIDPTWRVQVRRCTTPRPPVDLAEVIPALKPYARTAVRLHPRRGTAPDDASKIGGLFLWPAEEPWPKCQEHYCPFVAALQLRKEDVPELGFKEGSDLFQVLWCPHYHEPWYCPVMTVFWRLRSEVINPLLDQMASVGPLVWHEAWGQPEHVPWPCVLHPERVVEYPSRWELPSAAPQVLDEVIDSSELQKTLRLARRISLKEWRTPTEISPLYQCWLSVADGTKVGGHPNWVQGPSYPQCACGATMEYLATFSSWEFDGTSWGRWLPVEDRPSLGGFYKEQELIQRSAGWTFGDAGCVYLFLCRQCESWPIAWDMQCS